MSELKILLVSNAYPSASKKYSGIFVKNQYEELNKQARDDEQITIFYLSRSITGALGSAIKYIRLFFRFMPQLFKKYHVVHLHFFVPLISFVWLYKLFHPKTRLLVTFHGGDINLQVNKRNLWFYKPLARSIDLAIPVGEHVAANVRSKLDVANILVLPVGVDNRVFYPRKEVEKQFDFIYVGSFFHIKGIDIFYHTLCESDKSTRFCIVGKGDEYHKKFEELIAQGYDISLKIDQSHQQLSTLYNQSRFLVLPSRSEGFPTVTVEAMFCGTPVITSDIPQFKEQVRQGENGFMFNREQPEDLLKLMDSSLRMSDEQYKQMSKQAIASFPHLALNTVCARILKEYRC